MEKRQRYDLNTRKYLTQQLNKALIVALIIATVLGPVIGSLIGVAMVESHRKFKQLYYSTKNR